MKSLLTVADSHRQNLNNLTILATSNSYSYLESYRNSLDYTILTDGLVSQMSPYITIASKLTSDLYSETREISQGLTERTFPTYDPHITRNPQAINKTYAMAGVGVQKVEELGLDIALGFYGNLVQKVIFTASRESMQILSSEDGMANQITRSPRATACQFCILSSLMTNRNSNGTFHDFCRCVDMVVFPNIKAGTFLSRGTRRRQNAEEFKLANPEASKEEIKANAAAWEAEFGPKRANS